MSSPDSELLGEARSSASELTWTFLTNHAHVLLSIARDNDLRLREVAQRVGITERAVQRIVADLQDAGCLEVKKQGRRNRYIVHGAGNLRHPIEGHCTVRELIALVSPNTHF